MLLTRLRRVSCSLARLGVRFDEGAGKGWYALTRMLIVSGCVWLAQQAHALAQADAGSTRPAPFGVGGAYLFGFALGLVIFGLRQAIAARKAHMAGLKK